MEIDIGRGKKGRRAYGFDDIAIVPSRRTRDPDDIDISWTLGPYRFELPLVASAMDGVVSPDTAALVNELGGLGVLNLEGIWTRFENAEEQLEKIAAAPKHLATRVMQEIYAEPVKPELIGRRDRRDQGARRGRLRLADPAEGARALRDRGRGGDRHPRHPGHGDLGRTRLDHGRAAQPEGVHRRSAGADRGRRLRLLLDRAAPDADRRGRRPGRGRARAPPARRAACSGSASRRRPRSPTSPRPAPSTCWRPAST